MNQIKGLNYEIYIKHFLENETRQSWLWHDIPEFQLRKAGLLGDWNEFRKIKKDNKINGHPDLGCDVLLKDNENYILVQCKNFESNSVTIHHLAGFHAMVLYFNMEGIVFYTSKISSQLKWYKQNPKIQFIKQEMIENKIEIIPSKLQPYYYQIEAFNHLKDSNRSILSLPCGMGKTLTAIMIGRNYNNIILISPLISYAKQNLERFQNELSNEKYQSIIVNSDGTRDVDEILTKLSKKSKNILSFTYKSVDILVDLLNKLGDHIIIIDEFHNFSKNDIYEDTPMNKILLSESKILFMSATPKFFNLDNIEYINESIFGENIYSFPMARGISENFICNYEIYLPDLRINNNLTDILTEVDVSDLSIDLSIKAKFILRGILETGSKKCIIYLKNQEEATKMVNILSKLNEYFFIDNLYIDFIISDSKSSKRSEILNKFSENSGFSIICSVQILDECIDIPSCDSIFITYPSESKIRNIQRLCRANRKNILDTKKIAKIFLWCDEYNQIAIFISQLKEFDESFRENKICIMNISETNGGILERSKKEYQGLYKNLDDIIISIRKFGYGIDAWKKNLEQLKEFINQEKRRPVEKSSNQFEKECGHFLKNQLYDFKNTQNIMKLSEIRQLWENFIKEHQKQFVSNNDTWHEKLDELVQFIDKNNRLPTQGSSEISATVNLAKWIVRNNEQVVKNEKAMKDEVTKAEWLEFKKNHSSLFDAKADSWVDKYDSLIEFIKSHNRLPFENDKKDEEYYLKIWLKTQEKIYNKNKFGTETNKKELFEKLISKYSHLFSKVSNLDLWLDKYQQMIDYIEKHNQLPKEKIKVPDGISPSQKDEFERLKSLGVWKSNAVKNSKTDFMGKSDESSESSKKLNLWNKAKMKYPKLF